MPTRAVEWQGGAAFKRYLTQIAGRLGNGGTVAIGFFAQDRYSPVDRRGKARQPYPIAQVAAWQNWGTNPAKGPKIPARPFFTTAVKNQSAFWGKDLADVAKATGYDTVRTLTFMGESIKDDVVTSIVRWSQPPNAPRTIALKKFNKPLVDEGSMQRSVGFKVST